MNKISEKYYNFLMGGMRSLADERPADWSLNFREYDHTHCLLGCFVLSYKDVDVFLIQKGWKKCEEFWAYESMGLSHDQREMLTNRGSRVLSEKLKKDDEFKKELTAIEF